MKSVLAIRYLKTYFPFLWGDFLLEAELTNELSLVLRCLSGQNTCYESYCCWVVPYTLKPTVPIAQRKKKSGKNFAIKVTSKKPAFRFSLIGSKGHGTFHTAF